SASIPRPLSGDAEDGSPEDGVLSPASASAAKDGRTGSLPPSPDDAPTPRTGSGPRRSPAVVR
ncbi:hypothetical protein THAOC_36886, partial [Thalassiosira oceanica]